MKSIKVCEYSRSRSFDDDLILQDQASGEGSAVLRTNGPLVAKLWPNELKVFTNKDVLLPLKTEKYSGKFKNSLIIWKSFVS